VSDRRVKLLCTLGPATASSDAVLALVEAGTDVFRVNLSHGNPADHARFVDIVRRTPADPRRDLAVLVDLPGPKIRLGELATEPLQLVAEQRFSLRPPGAPGDERGAPITYPGLAGDVRAGDRILLSDGAVELVVSGASGDAVESRCVRGGSLRSGAGVNVPAERLSLPAITQRDREGLARALELGVDLVAQSFVRSAADVEQLRTLMGDSPVPIVAKIETGPAVRDIERIVEEADALMVARGDLGVELPMEEIPILQKELLRSARAAGKPAIVATQMLESMIRVARPTRAEASDVANAVLDGADAIMLSGETAIGEFPVEAARAAARIAERAERGAETFRMATEHRRHEDEANAVAHAGALLSTDDAAVVAIACYTTTGRTAALLSAERPSVPIYAFVPDASVRRTLQLRWGVRTLPVQVPSDTDEMISLMDAGLRDARLVQQGASVVMAASSPAGRAHTNMLKVHQVGDPVR
jgi:pyruvate kinase